MKKIEEKKKKKGLLSSPICPHKQAGLCSVNCQLGEVFLLLQASQEELLYLKDGLGYQQLKRKEAPALPSLHPLLRVCSNTEEHEDGLSVTAFPM